MKCLRNKIDLEPKEEKKKVNGFNYFLFHCFNASFCMKKYLPFNHKIKDIYQYMSCFPKICYVVFFPYQLSF